MEFGFHFVSLVLGADPELGTNGYIPAMFSAALKQYVTVWTNSESYMLAGGRLQPTTPPPGAHVYGGERRAGPAVAMIGIVLITSMSLIFVAFRNKR
jgi:hypothetical protein